MLAPSNRPSPCQPCRHSIWFVHVLALLLLSSSDRPTSSHSATGPAKPTAVPLLLLRRRLLLVTASQRCDQAVAA
jgi:hypothetical protein